MDFFFKSLSHLQFQTPLYTFLSTIKQQVKMGRGEINRSYHTRGRKMNWSLKGVLKVVSSILSRTKRKHRTRMNQGSWKDCSIWDHLNICIMIQCGLSMLPQDPYQKPKIDPWVLWQSLILHHVCMKPVSAYATLLQTFFQEERCETVVPLSTS